MEVVDACFAYFLFFWYLAAVGLLKNLEGDFKLKIERKIVKHSCSSSKTGISCKWPIGIMCLVTLR